MTTSVKTCFKCGAEKPLTDFYKHKAMADGHLNKCKPCTRRDASEHRAANLDRVRAYDRERGYREYDAQKAKARRAVRQLDRPDACSKCGTPGPVEGHHEDYSKPLEVIWVCKRCHCDIHLE